MAELTGNYSIFSHDNAGWVRAGYDTRCLFGGCAATSRILHHKNTHTQHTKIRESKVRVRILLDSLLPLSRITCILRIRISSVGNRFDTCTSSASLPTECQAVRKLGCSRGHVITRVRAHAQPPSTRTLRGPQQNKNYTHSS